MTQSYVKLTISPAAYDEIRRLLEAGGYKHSIMKSGTLDMFGFGLARGSDKPEDFKFATLVLDCGTPAAGDQPELIER